MSVDRSLGLHQVSFSNRILNVLHLRQITPPIFALIRINLVADFPVFSVIRTLATAIMATAHPGEVIGVGQTNFQQIKKFIK